MRMKLIAGALALAAIVVVPHWTVAAHAAEIAATRVEGGTRINIARIKHVLKLTAAQKRYWPAVEAALRGKSY